MKLVWFSLLVILPAVVVSQDPTKLRSGLPEEVVASSPVNVLEATGQETGDEGERELQARNRWRWFRFTRFPTRFPTKFPTRDPTMKPTIKLQCGEYSNSRSVVSMLETSSTNWGSCETSLSSVHSSIAKISGGVSSVNSILKSIESLTDGLYKTSKKVYDAASAAVAKLKSIPKVGKVIKAFLDILKKAKELLEKVHKRIVSFRSLFSGLSAAFKSMEITFKAMVQTAGVAETGYKAAAVVTNTAIVCTARTETCFDESVLEAHNTRIRSSVSSQQTASSACPRTFEAIARTLRAIADAIQDSVFNAVKKAIETLERALKPVFDGIKKIMDEIKKHLSEAYCCVTPFHIQAGLKFLSQIMDLATCPVDGAQQGVKKAMDILVNEMNKLQDMVIKKLLAPVSNVAYSAPEIRPGSVDSAACTFHLPEGSIRERYPFQPWHNALKSSKPSTSAFDRAAAAFGSEIVKTCKDAASEIGKGLSKDCCLDYKPLRDGQFCDPSSIIPYKKCTQCESGKHSFWLAKFHHACGKTPCGRDGVPCGKGTSCRNCCKGSSYWYKKAFTACGREPCWKDGTVCGKGTTCNACCSRKSSWWTSKFFTACGSEPCWGKGKRCAAGTSCKKCCRGYKWIWNKFGHFCK